MFEILIYIFKGIFQLLMWTWWVIVPIIAIVAFQNFRKSKWVEKNLESVVLSVKIPKNSDKGPTSAEMMFASLHGILKSTKELKREGSIQEHISFEMVADAKSIVFYVWTPKHLQSFVEGQVYAQYPTAEISTVEDYVKNIDIDHDGQDDSVAGCELHLVKPDYFPIKTFMNFEVDPLAGITSALSKIENPDERVWIQIITRPVSDNWRDRGLAYAEALKSGQNPRGFTKGGILGALSSLPSMFLNSFFNIIFPTEETKGGGGSGDTKLPHNVETSLACLEEKANKLGFQVKIRLVYTAKSREMAKQHLRIISGAFKQFNTTLANGFIPTKIRTGKDVLDEYRARLFNDKGFVLNIEEIASLYHLPHESVETPNIVWTSSKKGEPPATLPYESMTEKKELTVFAETTFRGQPKRFGIKKDDRRRHMYVIGKSGVGKSKLLEILAVADIERGEGVGIVDPHGELVHDILKRIPEDRINDVIYVNPADKDFPVGFNPLETTPDFREETTSGFIVALERLFGYSWGPRLEYVLRHTVLALTYSEESTMLSIVRMLTDKDFRKKVVAQVDDPVVKTFWLKEFTTYNDRFATEAVAPILNKVGQFTASPIIRNIIGQTKGTFDFNEAINSQKIILVDLSTGRIGEDNAELLGSFIITKLQLAAMARAKINPEDRKDFYLYVDEFQNFATKSFATILSEARKYKLNLTIANQYIAQMEESVRDAVFGNVGSLISFRVGATDAQYLEKEFSPTFEKDDLINLDNQHIYLNMLIDGVATMPFSAQTVNITNPDPEKDFTEKIILSSREKYSIPRQEIENKIINWSNINNVDIDARVEKQPTSKFEMSNAQIEKGETPKKIDEKRRANAFQQVGKQTNETNAQQPLKKLGDREDVPIKKSIDPEELKKIIQKVTRPSQQPAKEDIISENKNSQLKKIDASKKEGEVPLKKYESKKETETVPIKKDVTPAELKKIIQNEKSAQITKPKGEEGPRDIEEKRKENIKITKITGGAEIERVSKTEIEPKTNIKPIIQTRPRIQPQATQSQSPLKPLNRPVIQPISGFKDIPAGSNNNIEDENVRKITREEFMNLKEILPNEKIIIVDQKKGGEPKGKYSHLK